MLPVSQFSRSASVISVRKMELWQMQQFSMARIHKSLQEQVMDVLMPSAMRLRIILMSAMSLVSMRKGSSSKAVAYVGVVCNGRRYWGVGIDNDIIKASIEALTVAVNKIEEIQNAQFAKDKRMVEIMNYIQSNYLSVTLEGLSDKFYLSKPYLSKYIKEKSGMTFGELVKNVRLKKAKTLLKTSSMTVESIALSVGYQNVEHFNRLFKKAFNMTPVQFRNKK